MKGRKPVQTSLQGIAKKAKRLKDYRFRNLYMLLNEELLKDSWRLIKKNAAYGVDKVSAEEYEQNLDENIGNLVERLKEKRYRARLIRRHYIPRDDGKRRPLGIPIVEDKLLQLGVSRILTAIYEEDFLRCSYGYRPQRSVHMVVEEAKRSLQFGGFCWIVEADIRSYFDTIDHEWIMRMLEERIDDGPFLRLIKKWLKAGILDTDGKILHPATGTPQGGIVSPILVNVYLHYVLDLWFERVVKPQARGTARLFRYADDFVCMFTRKEDAERFYRSLEPRLSKFALSVAPEKTKVLLLDRRGKQGFEFVGFEFRWGRDRKDRPRIKCRTARKKFRASLARFTTWIRENRHLKTSVLFAKLNAKLRGYYNHYGIIGNYRSLKEFSYQMERILFKWLNRRSQRRSYTWPAFRGLKAHLGLLQPRITQRRDPQLKLAFR